MTDFRFLQYSANTKDLIKIMDVGHPPSGCPVKIWKSGPLSSDFFMCIHDLEVKF